MDFMKKIQNKDIKTIKSRLINRYKNAKSELEYSSLYELLVAVILSAQCTDKRVNIITPELFKSFPNVKSLAKAKLEDVTTLIQSCSFFNNKSKNLIAMAKMVMEEFDGKIPLNQEELIKLPGVGRKTANVVLIEYKNENFMAVDTHVFRVSHRLGLTKAKTVEETEKDLTKVFKTDLNHLHQGMVLFGRYICKARNPSCENECFLQEFCFSKEGFKPQ